MIALTHSVCLKSAQEDVDDLEVKKKKDNFVNSDTKSTTKISPEQARLAANIGMNFTTTKN